MNNRIDATFGALRAGGRSAFMPFIAAGDPDMATCAAILRECAGRGADLIELGVPYSDPVADGAAIQAAFTRALNAGATLERVFNMVRDLRKDVDTPIVSMLSYTIVFRVGPTEYMRAAADAGLDGVIIPDLPVEEAETVAEQAESHGLRAIFLVAPSTPEARLKRIVEMSTGFIYCVSDAGVTGERDRLPEELAERVRHLKSASDVPVAVGFGISTPDQARMVAQVADGAIVGSALVRIIHSAVESRGDPVKAAGDFVSAMAAAVAPM